MSQIPRIQVLAISDRVTGFLKTEAAKEKFQNIDLLLACGDIPYYYIESVMKTFGTPTFFVRGNHDNLEEFGAKGVRRKPLGAINLDAKVVNHNNILIAGFEGSVRYKLGPFMYSQSDMWSKVFSIIPKLLWNKVIYGRYIDVLISHAPPWDIYPKTDHVHQGFKAFNWLINKFKPSYHFHGHIHIDREKVNGENLLHQTKVINTYPYVHIEIQPGKKHYHVGTSKHVPRSNLANAIEDFRDARRKASLEIILDYLKRKPINLLSFDEINDKLREKKIQKKGLQKIPLDAIVGSVGRYQDFTRKFFPRRENNQDRWVAIRRKFTSTDTMKPIEVYQIGEVYFVLDGNHRVSVARQNSESSIQAYVTHIETALPLTPDDKPEDIIIKTQHINFLESTKINKLRPRVDFTVTASGKFRQLSEHIAMHQYFLGLKTKKDVNYEYALVDWVDNIYLPMVRIIRSQGLLREFLGRTSTDLFLWITAEQQELAKEIGWEVDPAYVAQEVLGHMGNHPKQLLLRSKEFILDKIRPKVLDPGPPIGEWRKIHYVPRLEDKLFSASLVAITGLDSGWRALEQALIIAKREKGVLRGVHIYPPTSTKNIEKLDSIRKKFNDLCNTEKHEHELLIEEGKVSEKISSLARWNDLVIFPLDHPPEDKAISRLKSGLRNIIQSSPRPLLSVPSTSPMNHALLAFDNSPKSVEALYLAAYFAEKWGTEISVVFAKDHRSEEYNQAKEYLDSKKIGANYFSEIGKPGNLIIEISEREECDFIIMGGYSYSPIIELAFGSTVDQILREYKRPVFICR